MKQQNVNSTVSILAVFQKGCRATARPLIRVTKFYYEGFSTMSRLGRILWIIIFIKLFIMFIVLRIFFFQPILSGKSAEEKSSFVAEELIDRSQKQ